MLYSVEGSGILPRFLLDSDEIPLCAQSDPEAFFPKDYFDETPNGDPRSSSYENERMVKEICNNCPLKFECLLYAIQTGQHGIWGGTTERERKELRRGRATKLRKSLGITPTSKAQKAVK